MKASFTIIELIVTVALFILLCSLMTPSFEFLTGDRLQRELERIEVVMKFLQQRAVACQRENTLYFNTQANSYYYDINQRRVEYVLPRGVAFGALPGVYGPPWQPTKPIQVAVTFAAHPKTPGLFLCIMHPSWQISPGSIYLFDELKHSLGALTCTVSRVSYIRRYGYAMNRWNLVSSQV